MMSSSGDLLFHLSQEDAVHNDVSGLPGHFSDCRKAFVVSLMILLNFGSGEVVLGFAQGITLTDL